MTEPPPITPAMKVAALLEAYPELEEVLIGEAPAFERLRNPVLRRTVARVATLEQAASIAGLSSRDLITRLRRAAGQPVDGPAAGSDDAPSADGGGPPAWLDPARVRRTIDADLMLASGATPMAVAFSAARALGDEDLLRITASFRPVPLVESLEKQGYACHLRAEADRFVLYVKR